MSKLTGAVLFLRLAAFFAGTGVALGAFAAHGLKDRLAPERLATFETGVRYQMYHALALLAVSLAWATLKTARTPWIACWAWSAGILLFSGSLYALVLMEAPALGAITPLGGLAFLAGWFFLFVWARQLQRMD